MQKLIWTNAKGDVVDLTSTPYGITNWEGFSNVPLNIQSQQVPFQDGGVFLDVLMEQRELSVTLAMYDENDLEARYRMRRELIHILNPKLGEGYLIYKNDFTQKRIKCVPQIPLFETHNSNDSGTPKASLSWIACVPYWEDLEEIFFNLNLGYENTLQYDGDVTSGVEAEIYISDITQNIKLIDNANNKTEIMDSFQNSVIKINTEVGKKTITEEVITEKYLGVLSKKDVVYGNGVYLIKAENNQNFYSYNGIDSYILDINWYRVRYIDEKKAFYCVDSNRVYKSVNGKDWNKIAEITSTGKLYNFHDICYGTDGLVIVGGDDNEGYDNNCCFISNDEETWVEKNIPTSTYGNVNRCMYVFFGNNKYYILAITSVGGRYNGELITTSDFENWNETLISGIDSDNITSAIFYDNELYISLSRNEVLKYDDAENNFIEMFYISYVSDLEIINHKLMMLCQGDDSSVKLYEITEDTYLLFKEITSTSDGNCFMVYNNDEGKALIYVGNDLYINYELSIHNKLSGTGSTGLIIYFPKTKEYFVSKNGKVYKSKDLYNWELIYELTNTSSISDFKYFEKFNAIVGLYTDVNNTNYLFYSYDGVNFTEVQYNLSVRMIGSYINEFKGNIYLVANDSMYGYSIIYKASDLDLSDIDGVYTSHGQRIYFSGCAISDNEMIYIEADIVVSTSDGINYVEREYNNVEELYKICYGQNEFVILSSNNTVIKGKDFSSLEVYQGEARGQSFLNIRGNLIYNIIQGLYYILLSDNVLGISANGVNWFIISLDSDFLNVNILNANMILSSGHGYAEIEKRSESSIINKLSQDSGLNISLFSGENSLKLLSDFQGSALCLIRYRQKYIGV